MVNEKKRSAVGKSLAAGLAVVAIGVACLVCTGCDTQVAETQKEQVAATDEPKWQDDSVIFRFNDENVTFADIKAIYEHRTLKPDERFSDFPKSEQLRFMKQIGMELLLAKEASSRGIEETADYRRNYYMWSLDKLFPLWITREIAEKITMTDEEILQYAPLALPEVKVRILVNNDPDKAQQAYERIKSGEDMSKVITEDSEGLSKAVGGLSGWMNEQQSAYFPSPVIRKYLDAEVGTLFPPAYQDVGFLVVRVEGKRSAEEVRQLWLSQVRNEYVLKRQQEVYKERLRKLRDEADIVVHEGVVAGVVEQNQAAASGALVEINGREFTASDVMGDSLFGQHGAGPVDGRIDTFVTKVVITDRAKEMGFEEDAEFQQALKYDRTQLLSDTLKQAISREAEKEEITDEQIEAFINGFPEEFTIPEKRAVSVIDVRSSDKAEEITAKLAEGGSFEQLAIEFSKHTDSAKNGGALGTYAADQMPPELSGPIFSLEEGSYTDPAVAVYSEGVPVWLILRVDAVEKASPMSVDRAKSLNLKPRIRTWLRTKSLADLVKTAGERFGYKNCLEGPC
ncbi:MAG: peptidyl-prolyl cis-trans isomerase [Deferrisomatales bacterium]|nr:peptidyl-prolyl cis-trans isomerase [Deferrisomatales bacterium]